MPLEQCRDILTFCNFSFGRLQNRV